MLNPMKLRRFNGKVLMRLQRSWGKNPDRFTAWFPQAFELVVSSLKQDAVYK